MSYFYFFNSSIVEGCMEGVILTPSFYSLIQALEA